MDPSLQGVVWREEVVCSYVSSQVSTSSQIDIDRVEGYFVCCVSMVYYLIIISVRKCAFTTKPTDFTKKNTSKCDGSTISH